MSRFFLGGRGGCPGWTCGGSSPTEKVMSRVDCYICPGGGGGGGGEGVQGGRVGLSWGVFTNRKSDVQGRLLDLSWGEGVGVQDGRVGLSWGVFTNRKSDVQGRLLDLSWGGGCPGWTSGFVLGGLHQKKSDVQGRLLDLSWGGGEGEGVQG